MEVRAISKSVRVSPRKVRLVADAVRHLSVEQALHMLQVTPKRAALPIAKTLQSAVANATNNAKLEKSTLVIGSIQVSEGQVFKRFRPSTRGRIHPYKKRSSTIAVVLKSIAVPSSASSAGAASGAKPIKQEDAAGTKAARKTGAAVEKKEKKKLGLLGRVTRGGKK